MVVTVRRNMTVRREAMLVGSRGLPPGKVSVLFCGRARYSTLVPVESVQLPRPDGGDFTVAPSPPESALSPEPTPDDGHHQPTTPTASPPFSSELISDRNTDGDGEDVTVVESEMDEVQLG